MEQKCELQVGDQFQMPVRAWRDHVDAFPVHWALRGSNNMAEVTRRASKEILHSESVWSFWNF